MKMKHDFVLRHIVGEYVLIPMGKGALEFSGMVSTNAVGALILEKLRTNTSREEIVAAICAEFEIDEATATADMEQFLARLEKVGLLENE